MSNIPTRRSFLALTGTAAAASLAGCSRFGSTDQSADGSEDPVTVQITAAEEEVTSLREEIEADIESGDLSQQEGQLEYRERRLELVESAATSFEESVSDSEFTIEESETAYGLFLVAGSADAILSELRNGSVGGVYPGDQYEQRVQQQQQQAQRREQQRALLEQQQQAADNETTNETNETDG
ncbi:hypothetical protein [Natrinema salsiterrestre]|uniref:Twin-arginine translocation signal domain-containing protein n=1 Tax=Natrinema salsiterrestre TaxID=2950540 RepID=A0A9Q4Q0M9_9EURY|nr:hypothetical protein [Natrinema salsiterrestre]MDF9746159.1 hypothetical protein [Natrinema salsiterrestre]